MATADRKPWKLGEIAREFHRRKHFAPYTMVWKKTLEGDMMDESLPTEMRVIIAIRHFAWGNFSDWAVEGPPSKENPEARPRQMTQDSLARILNISKSQMSKACTFLKGQGFLRKDHIFLYPEDHISPLESDNDSGVSSDSGNQSSSFLRYKESYLAENKELAESIAKMKDERKRLQDDALEISRELRRAQVPILTAWREAIKQEAQQNQQDTPDDGNLPDQTRLCAYAQNEMGGSGEHKANNGFISTESYAQKAVSDSTKKRFPTPDMPVPESGDDLVSKPNKNRNGASGALKSLNSLKGRQVDVGQSVSPVHSATTEQARLTDRQSQILSAIPSELLERLNDTPSPRLLDRIDQKLAHAPLQDLTERIAARWQTITALGILGSLADDVARAWRKSETDRVAGIPVGSEKKSALDQAADLQRLKYGTN